MTSLLNRLAAGKQPTPSSVLSPDDRECGRRASYDAGYADGFVAGYTDGRADWFAAGVLTAFKEVRECLVQAVGVDDKVDLALLRLIRTAEQLQHEAPPPDELMSRIFAGDW
jgi:hypothetical protein